MSPTWTSVLDAFERLLDDLEEGRPAQPDAEPAPPTELPTPAELDRLRRLQERARGVRRRLERRRHAVATELSTLTDRRRAAAAYRR